MQRGLMRWLESNWDKPDEGLWEVRGDRQHFVHSKVLAWVAADRAVRTIEGMKLDGPVDRYRALRDEIHRDVCSKGYDTDRQTFTQSYGSKGLDAALLLIPQVGFLPAEDERVRGTLRAVMSALSEDGMVRRYSVDETDDGQTGREGAFLACSFWLADALVMDGQRDAARERFEKLLSLRNDVGLLAEEYDATAGRQLGNMPQAYSHVALVNTALNLTESGVPERHDPDRVPGQNS
jgi:GH15 family glucan-1,4-alpha-glucosidase